MELDADGRDSLYLRRKEVSKERSERIWAKYQEGNARLEEKIKLMEEQERQRKIQEAIPKMTPKRVAEIAKNKNMWLHDPKTREWWTPEEYEDIFGRTVIGYEESVKRVIMKDPIIALNESFEVLAGDIKFEDRDVLLKKFKRFREFVGRVIGWYGG